MAANMYRVGDYVYFETASTSPFLIRRIEELNKTTSGNVEAKVMCFFRRKDISPSLVLLADKHQSALEEDLESPDGSELHGAQRHQLKHRELFLSRQFETLPATHIRGKCSVTLLNETESFFSYLDKEDSFFYTLVYDPQQKTLLADKGEIRVGSKFQVEHIPSLLKEDEEDVRCTSSLESVMWTPENPLTDKEIDQFLVMSRSVGTFARALDCSSSVKQPSLHMSAAAASRDITLFHAMDTLHKHTYNLSKAMSSLVPSSGPVLCRDEMEEWSASEANLFEEALEKYGKDFSDIRQDFLPWKSLKNIIEYYYMWKTTDRYVQQKRVKAVEAESKLKQVYIPNYNKPNPAAINCNKRGLVNGAVDGEELFTGKACESCHTSSSSQWFAWGAGANVRLCHTCWMYWKKYGGLKTPSTLGDEDGELAPVPEAEGQYQCRECNKCFSRQEKLTAHMVTHRPYRCSVNSCGKEFKLKAHIARHYVTVHGMTLRGGSPRPIMKTRTTFYLCTTPLTRISRLVCRHLLKPHHAARAPFWPINVVAIKQECQQLIAGKSAAELASILKEPQKKHVSVLQVMSKLGLGNESRPAWLLLTDKSQLPKPERVAFPPPPKRKDGSLIYDPPPSLHSMINNVSPPLLKRKFEDQNGLDGPIPKRPVNPPNAVLKGGQSITISNVGEGYPPVMGRPLMNHLNGRTNKIGRVGAQIVPQQSMGMSRKQVISWVDAPDDVYFQATTATKKLRRQLSTCDLRKAARKPWRKLNVKYENSVVVLD